MRSDSRSTLRSPRVGEPSRVAYTVTPRPRPAPRRPPPAAGRRALAPTGCVRVPGLDADRRLILRQEVVPRVERAAPGDRVGLLADGLADEPGVHEEASKLRDIGRARVLARRIEAVR